MSDPFEFEDSGRKYRCHLRRPTDDSGEAWWWFEVSGDQQAYGAFRAAKGDTRTSVRERVVSFYQHRLARLAEPPQPRYRGRPAGSGAPKPAASPETTAP